MSGRAAILSVALWGLFLAGVRIAVVPPESCGDDRPGAIAAAAERARDWMKRNQLPDGRYVYLYHADTDTLSSDYNEVRHAGVTMALYQAAGRYDDPEALAVADKGLAWMKDHVERRHGWAALSGAGPDLKLGATALMTVALAERRLATADTGYDGLMRDLGGFLAALQRPDGGFHVGWQLDSDQPVIYGTSRYYPGEAFWALALLHEAFPGEGWDEAARRAGEFITTRRDELEDVDFPPLVDQWAAYGLAEISERGLTMTFTRPSSSSSTRKTNPLAVPGRWRQTTRPATSTEVPSGPEASMALGRTPSCPPKAEERRKGMGWWLGERPMR